MIEKNLECTYLDAGVVLALRAFCSTLFLLFLLVDVFLFFHRRLVGKSGFVFGKSEHSALGVDGVDVARVLMIRFHNLTSGEESAN